MENKPITRKALADIILDGDKGNLEYDEKEITELILETKATKNINATHDERLSRGDILADQVASFAGSWIFISAFILAVAIWILANVLLQQKAHDPYPFILLNLIPSCIAALKAPVIMMSQNRREDKDRLRSKNDCRVNLKPEFLVEELYYKIGELSKAIRELKEAVKPGSQE